MRIRLYTAALAAAVLVTLSVTTPAVATTSLVVSGQGLSTVHLGAKQTTALATLGRQLGAPSAKLTSTPGLTNCGVAATASWHAMTVFFDHGRVVGFAFGPSHLPAVRTAAGLRLGDTLSRARALYGHGLTDSNTQGGAWFAATTKGRIDGFLTPSTGRAPTGSDRIETIDVGVVGCPAMSP